MASVEEKKEAGPEITVNNDTVNAEAVAAQLASDIVEQATAEAVPEIVPSVEIKITADGSDNITETTTPDIIVTNAEAPSEAQTTSSSEAIEKVEAVPDVPAEAEAKPAVEVVPSETEAKPAVEVVPSEEEPSTAVPEEAAKEPVTTEEAPKETIVSEESSKETVALEGAAKEPVNQEMAKESAPQEEVPTNSVVPEEAVKECAVPEEATKESIIPEEASIVPEAEPGKLILLESAPQVSANSENIAPAETIEERVPVVEPMCAEEHVTPLTDMAVEAPKTPAVLEQVVPMADTAIEPAVCQPVLTTTDAPTVVVEAVATAADVDTSKAPEIVVDELPPTAIDTPTNVSEALAAVAEIAIVAPSPAVAADDPIAPNDTPTESSDPPTDIQTAVAEVLTTAVEITAEIATPIYAAAEEAPKTNPPSAAAEEAPSANPPSAVAEAPKEDESKPKKPLESPAVTIEELPASSMLGVDQPSLGRVEAPPSPAVHVEKTQSVIIEELPSEPEPAIVEAPKEEPPKKTDIENGAYEATKEELEQSLEFIKAKLRTPSPPIAPPKHHKTAKSPPPAPEPVKEVPIPVVVPQPAAPQPVPLPVVKTPEKPKEPEQKPTETIPPVRPQRLKKKVEVPAWRSPKQNLIEYLFGCIKPQKE